MCFACWIGLGRPRIVNEKTLEATRLARLVFDRHPTGGKLHIVLDDWNLEDDDVQWCSEDRNHSSPLDDLERPCCSLLMTCSVQERASVLAMCGRYFDPSEALGT